MDEYVLGVSLSASGATTTALGLVLQKYSHERNALSDKPVVYYMQFWWVVGFSIFMLSQILNMVAMGLAPQTVLSALGAMCLIFSALFGWWLLGERPEKLDQLMMVLSTVGILCLMSGAPSVGIPFSGDALDVLEAMAKPVVFGVSVLLAMALIGFFALASFMFPQLMPPAFALLAAILTGYTVAAFKGVGLSLVHGSSLWVQPSFYTLILLGCFFGIAQMHALNKGLQQGEALVVVPIYYASGILAQILTGGLVFNELQGFSGTAQAVRFWGGTVVLVLCIFGMSYSRISVEQNIEVVPSERDSLLLAARERSLSVEWKLHRLRGLSLDADVIEGDQAGANCPTTLISPERRRLSSLDAGAFPESFGESPRKYVVSMTGPTLVA